MVDPGGTDQGALPLGEDLDALGGRIRPLIKLAGEVLHGKEDAPLREGVRHQVQLGLRQDGPDTVVKELRRDVLHIVAVEQPQPLQGGDPQQGTDVAGQGVGLGGEARPFFYIYPIYHYFTSSSARSARAPMSLRQ